MAAPPNDPDRTDDRRPEDADAHDLMPLLYDELRALTGQMLDGGDVDVLQATAVVHEVYLKLQRHDAAEWRDEAHFRAVAARAARQVLVDHARGRGRQKRGGGARSIPLDTSLLGGRDAAPVADVLEIEEALARLQQIDPRAANVIELRFYGGLSIDRTAAWLGLSTATVEREWRFARAWLHEALFGE